MNNKLQKHFGHTRLLPPDHFWPFSTGLTIPISSYKFSISLLLSFIGQDHNLLKHTPQSLRENIYTLNSLKPTHIPFIQIHFDCERNFTRSSDISLNVQCSSKTKKFLKFSLLERTCQNLSESEAFSKLLRYEVHDLRDT